MAQNKILLYADSYYSSVISSYLCYYTSIGIENITVVFDDIDVPDFLSVGVSFNHIKPSDIFKQAQGFMLVIVAFRNSILVKKALTILSKCISDNKIVVIDFDKNEIEEDDINNNDSLNNLPYVLLIDSGCYSESIMTEIWFNYFLTVHNIPFCQNYGIEASKIENIFFEKSLGLIKLDKNADLKNPSIIVKTISFDIFNSSNLINRLSYFMDNFHICYIVLLCDRLSLRSDKLFDNFRIKYGKKLNCIVESPFTPIQVYEGVNKCIKCADDFNLTVNANYSVSADLSKYQKIERDLAHNFCMPKSLKKINFHSLQ